MFKLYKDVCLNINGYYVADTLYEELLHTKRIIHENIINIIHEKP